MIIRKALMDDFDHFFSLKCQYSSFHLKNSKTNPGIVIDIYMPQKLQEKKKFVKTIRKRKSILFIAEKEFPVGYLFGELKKNKNTGFCYGYLSQLVVDKKFRCKGIAKKLMDEFEIWVKAKGSKAVTLDVIPENEIAYDIYSKKGYVENCKYMVKRL